MPIDLTPEYALVGVVVEEVGDGGAHHQIDGGRGRSMWSLGSQSERMD